MSLAQQITDDIKQAMRDKNAELLTTLRGIKSAFTNELVAQGKTPQDEVTDDIAMVIIKRQAKQRKDAIEQFTQGGRNDLVVKEQVELEIIEKYLPETMSVEEIKKHAEAKKAELGIEDKSKMGQLIGVVMKDLKDQVDGADVKQAVDSLFE